MTKNQAAKYKKADFFFSSSFSCGGVSASAAAVAVAYTRSLLPHLYATQPKNDEQI